MPASHPLELDAQRYSYRSIGHVAGTSPLIKLIATVKEGLPDAYYINSAELHSQVWLPAQIQARHSNSRRREHSLACLPISPV